ncbi:MAG: crossover junction endodeoxyribonuclease RuvC [Solirubrobacterales bacterium]
MTARAPLRVLGIDPGTASTGFGVVEARAQTLSTLTGGVISTGADVPLERRLASIAGHLSELLDEHRPDALAIEEVFFGRNARSAFAVGQARGAVLAAAGARQVPCFSYTPQAVKLAVCGSGAARKDQVQRMVAALLGLEAPPASDHAADALALAICHAHSTRGVRAHAQNSNT